MRRGSLLVVLFLLIIAASGCAVGSGGAAEPIGSANLNDAGELREDSSASGKAHYTVDNEDTVFDFSLDDKSLAIYFSRHDSEKGWVAANGISIGQIKGTKTIRVKGLLPGDRAYYKGADGLVFDFAFEEGAISQLSLKLERDTDSERTMFCRLFNDVELLQDQEAVIAYLIVSEKRADFSSWSEEALAEYDWSARGMQTFRVTALTR